MRPFRSNIPGDFYTLWMVRATGQVILVNTFVCYSQTHVQNATVARLTSRTVYSLDSYNVTFIILYIHPTLVVLARSDYYLKIIQKHFTKY